MKLWKGLVKVVARFRVYNKTSKALPFQRVIIPGKSSVILESEYTPQMKRMEKLNIIAMIKLPEEPEIQVIDNVVTEPELVEEIIPEQIKSVVEEDLPPSNSTKRSRKISKDLPIESE